jgi:glutaredoxin-related protein
VNNYKSFDVLSDSEMTEVLKELSKWPTFPQLYLYGKLVGGCDILLEMHKEGSLKEIFDEIKNS